MTQLNEKIRIIRLVLGYSQENLARDCGISQRAFSKIERGETKDIARHLANIAHALHVSNADLKDKPLKEILGALPEASEAV